MEIDVWDPTRGAHASPTWSPASSPTRPTPTCSAPCRCRCPHRRSTMTVGGDDGLGGNAPNDAAIGVTSYTTNNGPAATRRPMNFPRWYPTGTTMPDGSIVVQGGSAPRRPRRPRRADPGDLHARRGQLVEAARPAPPARRRTATAATATGRTRTAGGTRGPSWRPSNGNALQHHRHADVRARPDGNDGDGALTLRGTLGAGIGNQGASATRSAPPRRPRCTAPARSCRSAAAGGPTAAARPAPAPASRSTSPAARPTRSSPRPSR